MGNWGRFKRTMKKHLHNTHHTTMASKVSAVFSQHMRRMIPSRKAKMGPHLETNLVKLRVVNCGLRAGWDIKYSIAGAWMSSVLALTALDMMTSLRWCLKSGSWPLADAAVFFDSSLLDSYIEESESNPDCDEKDR